MTLKGAEKLLKIVFFLKKIDIIMYIMYMLINTLFQHT